jgi:hypothetical protein
MDKDVIYPTSYQAGSKLSLFWYSFRGLFILKCVKRNKMCFGGKNDLVQLSHEIEICSVTLKFLQVKVCSEWPICRTEMAYL